MCHFAQPYSLTYSLIHEIYLISEIEGNNPNYWRAAITAAPQARFKGGKEKIEMLGRWL